MLPPRPPFPPSGPPRGTYFSRRKLSAPAPPSPALAKILTRSVNISPVPRFNHPGRNSLDRFGEHRDFLALMAGALETHDPVDQREQGVITPHPDVGPGEDRGAALAKNDRPGIDRLAGAGLHPEPLPDTVASVA